MKITPSEELILAGCNEGSEHALQELSEKIAAPVYGFLSSSLGKNAGSAHDLFIEAFICGIRNSLSENTPILVKVLSRLIHDISKLPFDKKVLILPENVSIRAQIILRTLSYMSWNDRVLVLLRDQLDLSHEEMSAVLSMNEHVIKMHLTEARIHFRNYLNEVLKKCEGLA